SPDETEASVIQKATSWFSSMFTNVMEADLVKFVAMCVARLTCYLCLYAHAPNLLNTVALGALIFMDVKTIGVVSSDAKALLSCLVEGDVKGLCTAIAEKMDGMSDTDEERAEEMRETMSYAKLLLDEEDKPMENQ
nr:2B protein [Crohivirus A]